VSRFVGALGLLLVVAAAITAPAGTALRAGHRGSFAVGLTVVRWTDRTRTIRLPNGRIEPRRLVTYVRYPASGASSENDVSRASAARGAGPFPLVVFGHGFAVTPSIYAPLLHALAAAGYVVAAPVFPLGNANAPGGPDEQDIVNQPGDMSFVVSQMLAANSSPHGLLSGLVDPSRIAVAGHSDGGETALATAYDRDYRDSRVRAAIILSGAKISGPERLVFPAGGPPLLATQGSADKLNRPKDTRAFFDLAPRPKFLLTLLGAGHLPPYTYEQPQLSIVERVTVAFLDHYFKGAPLGPLVVAGHVPGVSTLTSDP
jgi:pimeloyl-ACP methyl ester carboxylesterase